MLSAKPPQCRIPKGTLGIGSPPSPRATRARRPGSLKITSSCASTGCGAVTLTASRRPRRHATARCVAVIAPACRHPSRQPSAPPFEKYGVEKTPARQKEAGTGIQRAGRRLCVNRHDPRRREAEKPCNTGEHVMQYRYAKAALSDLKLLKVPCLLTFYNLVPVAGLEPTRLFIVPGF